MLANVFLGQNYYILFAIHFCLFEAVLIKKFFLLDFLLEHETFHTRYLNLPSKAGATPLFYSAHHAAPKVTLKIFPKGKNFEKSIPRKIFFFFRLRDFVKF